MKDVAVRQELALLLWEVEAIKAGGLPKSARKAVYKGFLWVFYGFSIWNSLQNQVESPCREALGDAAKAYVLEPHPWQPESSFTALPRDPVALGSMPRGTWRSWS